MSFSATSTSLCVIEFNGSIESKAFPSQSAISGKNSFA